MFGPPGCLAKGSTSQPGVALRIMQQLFREAERYTLQDRKFVVNLSVVDLYNEQMFDLLSDTRVRVRLSKKRGAESTAARVPVADLATALILVRAVLAKRVTAATLMNDHSSRSH